MKGFTIMELIITVLILSVLSGIGYVGMHFILKFW